MTEEQLSKMLKPLEWYKEEDYPGDEYADTNLWYNFYLDLSIGEYSLLKVDINHETYLMAEGIKTLEEGKKLAWEEYVKDVISMF